MYRVGKACFSIRLTWPKKGIAINLKHKKSQLEKQFLNDQLRWLPRAKPCLCIHLGQAGNRETLTPMRYWT